MTEPFRNLVDLHTRSVARFGGNPYLGTRQRDGSWRYVTYREFGGLVADFRAGLAGLGLGRGDRIALISDNRVEWAVTAYATYSLGACIVPMYPKQSSEEWRFILEDSGAGAVLVANDRLAEACTPLLESVASLEHVVNFEGPPEDAHSYVALLEAGRAKPVPAADPDPGDLCGFIYTSGTTGQPKGVRLTHGNITSNVNAVQSLFPMQEADRSLSFLPWAHSFGQTVELHCGTSFGASAAICDDVSRLLQDFPDVQPTMLFSVPRVFNRIYDGLNKRIAAGPGWRRRLFAAALANGQLRKRLAAEGRTNGWVELKHRILDRLVFAKVRASLGGRLRFAFSGGAAISREVAEFIDTVGITVYEGYGLSETSPIATANFPGHQKIGSVGRAIPGVEVFVDRDAVGGAMGDEGEILIKGPNIMEGYHGLPEQTAEVMREDGAFRSGDLGHIDEDGYVYITGRIKEQYKLENGKYVVPAPLEEQLKLSGFINQVMVYGANRPFNVALVVPDVPAVVGWARARGLEAEMPLLLKDEAVRGLIEGELERLGSSVFKSFERIGRFALIAEEFSIENHMLTPTLKLKRRIVIKEYQPVIDSLYAAS